jgi:menaquinone-dependent protoporphyrinogen IX oxidase
MKKVLVAYATNSGTTADVARTVADELGKDGAQVDVLRVEQVTDLEAYDAVVLGAPMIMGWHRAAVKFLKKHQAELGRVPLAYFITARSLTRTEEASVDGIPIRVDPDLAKAPANLQHLSLRERYARVDNYLRPTLKAAPRLRPVSVAFFNGRLDLYGMKWWQMLFVLLVIQAKPGGSHNLPFIREWAASLLPALSDGRTASTLSG